eukprot:4313173-Alexandrium_andersonii.AAC.1
MQRRSGRVALKRGAPELVVGGPGELQVNVLGLAAGVLPEGVEEQGALGHDGEALDGSVGEALAQHGDGVLGREAG